MYVDVIGHLSSPFQIASSSSNSSSKKKKTLTRKQEPPPAHPLVARRSEPLLPLPASSLPLCRSLALLPLCFRQAQLLPLPMPDLHPGKNRRIVHLGLTSPSGPRWPGMGSTGLQKECIGHLLAVHVDPRRFPIFSHFFPFFFVRNLLFKLLYSPLS